MAPLSPARTPPIATVLLTELRRALIALGYFTRAPIPSWVGASDRELDRAARYLPLVGVLVGAVGAGVLLACARLWPVPVAVALSMVCTVLFTGGFHEDGLADSADGFGGGSTRERVLDIMRDPRIGSFGAMALVLVLLTKFGALLELARASAAYAALALVIAHAGSRGVALLVMARLPYARPDEDAAKARPVAQGVGPREWITGAILAASPAVLAGAAGAIGPLTLLTLLTAGALVLLAATRYLRARLGGYTGDALGATQQIGEIAIYLVLLAALR
jgi:adenosylcobinamide-GDP ribazoletransferase